MEFKDSLMSIKESLMNIKDSLMSIKDSLMSINLLRTRCSFCRSTFDSFKTFAQLFSDSF